MHIKMVPENPKTTNTQGFTLIEVMIAMAIFAIGILAVTGMQIRSINQNASARMQTEATALAADWMEQLLSFTYEDPDLDEGDHLTTVGAYRVAWTVDEDLDMPTIKHIVVTVTNANTNAKTVQLSSIKGQGEDVLPGP